MDSSPFPSNKDRSVLRPFAEFDPAKSAGFPSAAPVSIRSVAVSPASDSSHTLVYVGTGGGKVILLLVNPPFAPASEGGGADSGNSGVGSSKCVEFLRWVSVGNRLVESIIVLSEIGRILVLSDGFVFLLDLMLVQPVRKLGFIKDVTAVTKWVPTPDAANLSSFSDGTPKAETSTGQKLLQKLGGGIRTNGVNARITEPHRGGNSVYIAMAASKKLVLVELQAPGGSDVGADNDSISFFLKDIQGFEGVKTLAWLGNSIIIGTANGYTLISTSNGNTTLLFTLPESSRPPLLKSLWRSKEVLLLVDNVGVVANSDGQPIGGSLVFQYVPDSVAEMSSYVIVVRDGKMDLFRRGNGVCVQSVSFAKGGVGQCLVTNDEQGAGEIIVVATPYKAICFCKVPSEEQIKNLLRKKNFKEAICLVEECKSEGEITKEMISFVHAQIGFLLLFNLHFEDAVNHFLLSETMHPAEIFPFIMRDPNRWSHLVPRNRYWGLHPPPAPLEEVIDDGLAAIRRALLLRKAGLDTNPGEDFFSNPPSRADLLESAIRNIIRYLCASHEKDLSPPVKEGVDTLLMHLYRALNLVDDMEKLASSDNDCIVEELETLLNDSGHLRTLAYLYASKGICSKALAIWRIIGRNYSSGFWRESISMVPNGSLSNSLDTKSGRQAAAAEASKLLQESSDQDLVLEHLGWIADIDQELAVLVLTSEKRVKQLSPEKVLAAIDPRKVQIEQSYLQWLIEDQGSDDNRLHTLYALSLARTAVEAVEVDRNGQDKEEMSSVGDGMSDNYLYSARNRLQLFLQASDLYNPQEVLNVIDESELWLEKAILYRKMGQESMVLQILALKLEDSESAEQYCAEIGSDDAYLQLLELYLNPGEGKEPMFKAAVSLLHSHGVSLDPLQVLEKLSPDMPLKLASDTITRMLRARAHHYRQGQIVHSLSGAENLDARLARFEERSRNVQINDKSVCDSCHSRLGTKLFAMYPDDSIVCYKCYRRLGESISAHGRNFKQDIIFKPGWLVSR